MSTGSDKLNACRDSIVMLVQVRSRLLVTDSDDAAFMKNDAGGETQTPEEEAGAGHKRSVKPAVRGDSGRTEPENQMTGGRRDLCR
jgi:hypothetical protein